MFVPQNWVVLGPLWRPYFQIWAQDANIFTYYIPINIPKLEARRPAQGLCLGAEQRSKEWECFETHFF